jgi:hypothetical protein
MISGHRHSTHRAASELPINGIKRKQKHICVDVSFYNVRFAELVPIPPKPWGQVGEGSGSEGHCGLMLPDSPVEAGIHPGQGHHLPTVLTDIPMDTGVPSFPPPYLCFLPAGLLVFLSVNCVCTSTLPLGGDTPGQQRRHQAARLLFHFFSTSGLKSHRTINHA